MFISFKVGKTFLVQGVAEGRLLFAKTVNILLSLMRICQREGWEKLHLKQDDRLNQLELTLSLAFIFNIMRGLNKTICRPDCFCSACLPVTARQIIFLVTFRVSWAVFEKTNPIFNMSAVPTLPSQRCSIGSWTFQMYFCLIQTEIKMTVYIIKWKAVSLKSSPAWCFIMIKHLLYLTTAGSPLT